MVGLRGDFRWGDAEDDDGIEDVLPPPQVFGPDEKGIKKIVEWRINEDGSKIKVTKTIRIRKQVKKLSPVVLKRRQWKKFGQALGQNASDNLTVVSTEEIFLERTRPVGQTPKVEDKLAEMAVGNTVIICRACGKKGDHWTSKCPFKDLKGFLGDKPPGDEDISTSAVAPSGPGKSSYVPPSMRGGAKTEGDSMRRGGRDENSIRVTNLSEDTREQDLQELFRPFGPISRIYIALDRDTRQSRGFAFINYVNREDAERAIKKLDGYGYDNLILRVEWATPRTDRA